MTATRDRVVVVTVGLAGADGVAEVSRQWLDAFVPLAHAGRLDLGVWSLDDREPPAYLARLPVQFRAARGSRLMFASFGLRSGATPPGTLFVVMHLHLLPVLLPRIYRGARVAVLLHGVEAWKPLSALTAQALKQCWRVVAVSAHTVEQFHRANPSLADVQVQICAPGVPPAVHPDTQPAVAASDGSPSSYALIVARMAADERYKGHDELIDLWPRVLNEVPDARLVVAGGGDDEMRLRTKAAGLGLGDAVVFAGRVSAERLAALYRDARFFVMPSRNEGFGLVYLEAMRAGKPCIASPGAAEEIIQADINGFIVDSQNGDALQRAIVRLWRDEALRARIGAAAAVRVTDRFTAAHVRERVYGVLDVPAVPVAC